MKIKRGSTYGCSIVLATGVFLAVLAWHGIALSDSYSPGTGGGGTDLTTLTTGKATSTVSIAAPYVFATNGFTMPVAGRVTFNSPTNTSFMYGSGTDIYYTGRLISSQPSAAALLYLFQYGTGEAIDAYSTSGKAVAASASTGYSFYGTNTGSTPAMWVTNNNALGRVAVFNTQNPSSGATELQLIRGFDGEYGPIMEFYHNRSTSATQTATLGTFIFKDYLEAAIHVGAKIDVVWDDVTAGSEDSGMEFFLMKAGNHTLVKTIDINGGATPTIVFNYPLQLNDAGTAPTCDVSVRGMLWYETGGANDTLTICMFTNPSYAWVTIKP